MTKTSKQILQEFYQKRYKCVPHYVYHDSTGAEHEKIYYYKLVQDVGPAVIGRGTSRKKAEQDAAEKTLLHIKNNFTIEDADLKALLQYFRRGR